MAKKTVSKIDFRLILFYIILVGIGFMNLYSSDYYAGSTTDFLQTNYGKELVWIGISIVIAGLLLLVDSYVYFSLAYAFYLFILGLLFLVIVIGVATNGAQSWLGFGSIKIQPSEFAKVATALALAKFLSDNPLNSTFKSFAKLSILGIIIFIPVVFILLQPDVGSALVFFAFVFVLYREGLNGLWLLWMLVMIIVFVLALKVSMLYLLIALTVIYLFIQFLATKDKKLFFRLFIFFISFFSLFYFVNILLKLKLVFINIWIVTIVAFAFIGIYFFIRKRDNRAIVVILFLLSSIFVQFSTNYAFKKILKQHQRNRIEVLFDNTIDPRGIGYNLRQSKIAIGSGGFWGKGYLKGTQTKLNFVPAHDTDFVFCTLAEEWGLLGVTVYFIIYSVFLIFLIIKSEQQKSSFVRIYGYSVFSLFFFHFFVNIGMTIGLLPVIGIPLPFFSYGGSSMLAFTMLLFIFIKLDSQRNIKL